ncbi:MAG TPA: TonB-dependent receptor [Rhodocyclaceae bacterium]|jgi:iron complex outermembrane receptor protein|nr:TonB-dependent receptor [Rhodocyclaceae bacterium]TXG80921.1 MAG: TonB-dependent receptor [Rhodocyclaceae bacterium]HNB78689.1 TonB-dependent receptor [Rhodocyclaceae bacterium]HNH13768.1 TonB-dependent receptor [Rhodocyclaceae bacterium]HNH98685.1 TonB-dependent receptor [Rhodocyclaceae bacterium]
MKTKHRRRLRLLGKASFLVLTAGNASAQQPDSVELPSVKVIATRPLPDIGTPVERIPSNVQAVTATELRAHQSLNLPDFLSQSLPGVTINEAQNNPFQPDVNFRGFTASPLLGTAQGLSVFVDGVRINEPFGDTVNWDLIPMNAISSMSLIPGSNPLFGLNTLGGALSIQTKTGAQYPGVSLQASGGSWGRRSAEFEYGGKRGNVDWFLSGNLFREDGWRDFSPSRVRQLFGKLGWETATTDIDLSYTHADNDLTGNGFTPESMLRADREASFTYPDNTRNRLDFFNGRLSHWFSDNMLFSGNVYHRQNRVRTFNGDVNDEYADEFEELIEAGGECALDADPEACAVAAMAGETGVNNRTTTRQRGYGLSAQLTAIGKTASGENQLTAGFAVDKSRTRFEQSEQEAVLTPSRGTASDEETELVTRLRGSSRTWSLYATDTFSWNGLLHFTLSGRYNHTNVELDDRLGTELDGRHTFRRFNPAAGISYTPFGSLTLFAGYSEGNRAPSPIELGCADPEIPCKLPNAMAADPPLKQVVAKTSEIGARGRIAGIDWATALFHTINRDDIQFIASSSTGAGYFDNVGKTRRRGVEFNLAGEHGRLRWNLGYAYVDATYRSALRVLGENNSTADDDGFIDVEPGSRIPGIPRHSVKLGGSFRVTDAWTIGATATAYSDQYARGNENNRHRAGTNAEGEEFEGSGRIPGYVIVNLDTKYAVAPGWEVFAKVSNIFDRRYSSAGILGENPFGAGGFNPEPDEWRRETALAPGAPRAGWIGIRASFK